MESSLALHPLINAIIMKTFWLFLSLLVLAAFNQPQGLDRKIFGTVFSLDSGDPLEGVLIEVEGTRNQVTSDQKGKFEIIIPGNTSILVFSLPGFVTRRLEVGSRHQINLGLSLEWKLMKSEEEISDLQIFPSTKAQKLSTGNASPAMALGGMADSWDYSSNHNTEEYDHISENIFHSPRIEPLSTFSIDVDGASYSNVRRFLNNGQLPPKDAIRVEEFVNYFSYSYQPPLAVRRACCAQSRSPTT